ncbi:MAG: ABC transporter substrate-binding protein [Flavobacteriales bacterium]|nr:ABC transporter substrate-binding protein [Flavobacteriales bacterium]MCB9449492.1 ABC transporter substrate-binding protein [Flavobacteriales bacterium]
MFKYTIRCAYALLVCCGMLACQSREDNHAAEAAREGNGGVVYGGNFRWNFTEQCESLNPVEVSTVAAISVVRQMHEGLVRIDYRTMKVEPGLALSWDVDSSRTRYTFHLRDEAMFQDDNCFPGGKGRKVVASDVLYSFENLCTYTEHNVGFNQLCKDILVGADTYYQASRKGKPQQHLEGVNVMDDHTVEISLVKPLPGFLYLLSLPAGFVIPEEAVKAYGTNSKIGAGPFKFAKETEYPKSIVLTRNPNYYRKDTMGNQLPYLDSLSISFMTTKEAELSEFMEHHLDMAYELPGKSMKEIVEKDIEAFQGNPPKFILGNFPELMTQFYVFNLQNPFLAKLKVRQAFNYAINKDEIVDNVLVGQASGPAIYGICPPNIDGYDIKQFSGYTYDPDKARALLAEAGYPDGKGAPKLKLELNTGGARHAKVAFEIAKQLEKELHIQLDLEVVPFPKKMEDEMYARADIFRSGWLADYPGPDAFLNLFYGKNVPENAAEPSFPNTSRYKNPDFDVLFEKAVQTVDRAESYRLFAEAEKLMLADAPVIPLWYEEIYILLQSNVHGFVINPLRMMDCSQIYFKAPEKREKK